MAAEHTGREMGRQGGGARSELECCEQVRQGKDQRHAEILARSGIVGRGRGSGWKTKYQEVYRGERGAGRMKTAYQIAFEEMKESGEDALLVPCALISSPTYRALN